jgi:predicted dinucleotide-binding enzyme
MTTIGLIGAGLIGSTVARLAVTAGYDVVLSNSRGPETLRNLVEELGPQAKAATAAEAATEGDLVVVTIPLRAYLQVPVQPLAGKVVIDTNNYYPQRDGHIAALDRGITTSSALLQEHLADSRVTKAFNSIYFGHLATLGRPVGDPSRGALPIAGDDAGSKQAVTALLDDFGYDAYDAGPLSESWRFEPGAPAYGLNGGPELGRSIPAEDLAAALAAARRSVSDPA